MPAGQSASLPSLSLTVFPGRGRHVPALPGAASGLSFCGELPPSLLSSVVFPCWFPGCCAASPCSGKVPPTREGSGTWSTGRRPKNRASFRYLPTVRGALVAIAALICWCDVLGLRFLSLPEVTSARSELRLAWHVYNGVCCAFQFSVFGSVLLWFVQACCSQQEQENMDSPPGSR